MRQARISHSEPQEPDYRSALPFLNEIVEWQATGGNTGKKRHEPKVRRALILEAAAALAKRDGLASLTRKRVADAAQVSEGTVCAAFATMPQLSRAVRRHIDREG